MTEEDRIDAIIDHVDEAFCDGRFDEIDREIRTLDVSTLGGGEIHTWLIATKWATEKLPSRPEFFQRCEKRFYELEDVERSPGVLERYR